MEQFEKLILSVSQLNNYLKGLIDEIPLFRNIYVSGEISNFTNHYRTGHFYFTLKDDKALIKAVMFHSYAQRLRFLPENGMEVLVKARLSVFERDGIYQLYVEDMQPKGIGGLNLAFEQLKNKLQAQGLFDAARKKALPRYPKTIGVITSPTGAAVQDITNILTRRFPIVKMILEPVQVQGEAAPAQIIQALEKLNREHNCDIIILGRGGGSIEDLWAFNNEALAYAIAASEIPVISAVGHETDFTIADFVADLRAPTPSAAAEIAVPDLRDVKADLAVKKAELSAAVSAVLNQKRLELERIQSKPCLKNISFVLDENRMRLNSISDKLENAYSNRLLNEQARLSALASKLDALSPLKVISRGYSVTRKENKLIKSIQNVAVNDVLNIQLSDGSITATVYEVKYGTKNEL